MLRPPNAPRPGGGQGSNFLSVNAPIKLSGPPKVPLPPGKGLMDWVKLCNDNKDLSGVGGKPRKVTEKDLAMHKRRDDCWMILHNKVYNISPYMLFHPGGADELMRAAGRDGTGLFNEIHPWVNYESMMKSCFIGFFVGSKSNLPSVDPPISASMSLETQISATNLNSAVSPSKFHSCTIASVSQVNHDCKLYEIIPPEDHTIKIDVGHHIFVRIDVGGMLISRAYTPVTKNFGLSVVPKKNSGSSSNIMLLIKIYKNGTITPIMDRMSAGDLIDLSDATGTFVTSILDEKDTLLLIAAGTGITPLIKVIEYWNSNRNGKSPPNLLFFNKTNTDIIWKDRLESMSKSRKLIVSYVLSNAEKEWKELKGRISKDILKETFSKQLIGDLESKFVCICGPNEFTNSAVRLIKELGLKSDQIHAFKS